MSKILMPEIPKELKEAQQNGTLLVFAGAGVSVPPPSDIPVFSEICRNLENEYKDLKKDNESIDEFLGRMKKYGHNVHYDIASIIKKSLRPNELHYSIIKLFNKLEYLRIVTTNFDIHFSTILKNDNIDIYYPPHITLGYQFSGLVYLHGCIENNIDDIIITNEDIARAYRKEKYAEYFLDNIFKNYTILFIGYSMNDPLIPYQYLGVDKKEKSFALTLEEDSNKWENIEITPLVYTITNSENKHEVVVKVIRKWASEINKIPEKIITIQSLPLIDHENRIKKLANEENINIDEIHNYLQIILKETATTKIFFSFVKAEPILKWLDKNNYLEPLFSSQYKLSDRDKIIANWIGYNFIKQKPNLIFNLLHKYDNIINPEFWDLILWHLSSKDNPPEPNILSKWIIILLDGMPSISFGNERLEFLLIRCRYPEDKFTAIRLFEYLTTPIRKSEPSFSFTEENDDSETIDSRVTLRGHDYYLRESWEKYFKPNLHDLIGDIKPIVNHHLITAFKMNVEFGHAGDKYDSESWFRSAIEKHPQNKHYRKMDVLIDAARDLLEHMLVKNHDKGLLLREEWCNSDAILLKRVAIHGYAYDINTESEKKLDFILLNNLLFDLPYKHEVFRVIKMAFEDSSDEIQNKLIEKVLEGPIWKNDDNVEEKLYNYEIYNLLYWIYKNAPKSKIAINAYKEYQKKYPEFKGREYPDFDHWTSEAELVTHESPYSLEYFLNTPLDDTLEMILTFVGSKHYEGPDRRGMLNVLSNAVINSFDWSIALSNKLVSIKEWKDDVWEAIIQGWEKSSHSDEAWLKIFDILTILIQENGQIPAIGSLLETGAKNVEGGISISILKEAEVFSDLLFESLQILKRDYVDDFGWLTEAINQPAGKTAEFWLQALSKLSQSEGDSWKCLPMEYKLRFEDIIDNSSYSSQLARVTLNSRFNFLYYLDPDWSLKNLFPLFDWDEDSLRAEQSWHGFLMWGRIPESLRKEFYPLLVSTAKNLNENKREIREVFFKHVVAHAIYDTPKDLKNSWFYKIIAIISPEERKSIVHEINSTLWDLKDDNKDAIWNRFLKIYWKDRIGNIPVVFGKEESNEFILLLPRLEPVLPEVVELICQMNTFDHSQTHIFYDLSHHNLDEKYPLEIGKLLIHLLANTSSDFIYCYEIEQIYKRLSNLLPERELQQLREVVLRIGCTNI